jgi:hypothetical protein
MEAVLFSVHRLVIVVVEQIAGIVDDQDYDVHFESRKQEQEVCCGVM